MSQRERTDNKYHLNVANYLLFHRNKKLRVDVVSINCQSSNLDQLMQTSLGLLNFTDKMETKEEKRATPLARINDLAD